MKNETKSKNKKAPLVSNSRGIALVLVLIVLILMTSLGLSVASTTTIEVQIASRSEEVSKGFYYAEAGLNMAVSMIKQMKGDFNDLLAGPDSLTSGVGLNGGLETHRNEFVTGSTSDGRRWPNSTITYTLPSSTLGGPMFPDEVRGFTLDESVPISNNTDIKAQLGSTFGNAKTRGDNARWGGKITFPDSSSNSRYEVYVEIYDDDDPYARLFNAYPGGSGATAYPTNYTDVIAPIYKIPGPNFSTDAYNMFDACNKEFVECPGKDDTKFSSFSGRNKDFNARVLIRSTARQVKVVGSTDTVVSEVTVDSIVGFFPYPAVITVGCTSMQGGSITGSYGGIHANAGLCLGSPTIEQTATSSTSICTDCPTTPSTDCTGNGGGLKVCGFSGGNQPILVVPDLNPVPALTTDPIPPLPQTPPLAYNNANFAESGWFWAKDVVDRNPNGRAGKKGADLVFLGPKGNNNGQRTYRHGTSSSSGNEDGLLRALTAKSMNGTVMPYGGMTEANLVTFCDTRVTDNNSSNGTRGVKPNPSDTIILDRGSDPNDILIASMQNNGNFSDWYRLSNANGSGNELKPERTQGKLGIALNKVGWTPGNDENANGSVTTACGCSAPVAPSGSPSRARNGILWNDVSNDLQDAELAKKVYFFDGSVKIAGSPGSVNNLISFTIITTGSVDIEGSPKVTGQLRAKLDPIAPPFTNPQIFILAGTDIQFTGDTEVNRKFEGLLYAREQIELSGNSEYAGQVIAADITSFDKKVTANKIAGSAKVTFNGSTSALGAVKSSSYRLLKF